MIVGLTVPTQTVTDQILSNLHTVKSAEFILTGSRVFGNATKDSDYDFFCEESLPTREILKANNFKVLYCSTYTDTEIHSVFRHYEARVDIQLVRDASLKQQVQTMMLHHDNLRRLMIALPKSCRGSIWDLAYCIITRQMPDSTSSHYNTLPLTNLLPFNLELKWVRK